MDSPREHEEIPGSLANPRARGLRRISQRISNFSWLGSQRRRRSVSAFVIGVSQKREAWQRKANVSLVVESQSSSPFRKPTLERTRAPCNDIRSGRWACPRPFSQRDVGRRVSVVEPLSQPDP